MNSDKYLLFDMELLNHLFCDMFGSVLECYELTHISWSSLTPRPYIMGCLIMFSHSGFIVHSPAPKGVMHEWAGIVTPLVV